MLSGGLRRLFSLLLLRLEQGSLTKSRYSVNSILSNLIRLLGDPRVRKNSLGMEHVARSSEWIGVLTLETMGTAGHREGIDEKLQQTSIQSRPQPT